MSVEGVSILACPESRQPLSIVSLQEAERRAGGRLVPRVAAPGEAAPFGATDTVALRADARVAYPVVDGIPVLLIPEGLTTEAQRRTFDLKAPQYAESYQEMEYYNAVATEQARHITDSEAFRIVRPVYKASAAERQSFPHPRSVWIDAVYDSGAQWDAYEHIGKISNNRILQMGGVGLHAIKFLLGGAAEAWVLTPMIGEVRCAIALAEEMGVADRLRYVVSVAEELPFVDDVFDAIYSGGCLHHMVTDVALPEAARILKPGGKFAATDPWRAPLYAFGTKLLGKREPEVFCRPLTRERVAPAYGAFREARIVQHGTLTRYPLLALNKFGIHSSLGVAWTLNRIDDAVCSAIPGMRRMGSSVATLGTK